MEDNNLFIQVIARLNKALSKKQIETDIKGLEKTPFYIKLIGRLNKSLTRNQIEHDIQDIQSTASRNPIEINAEINSDGLQQSVNEALTNIEQTIQNNPINIDINANVGNVNTDEIIQGQQQVERQTQRILGDYVNAYRIFQRITQAIQSAVAEIEKLNKAEIDLQMITQKSSNEVKSLMQDYNSLAKETGSTTLQVTDGASEWLRQGKSISDTNTLIRDSMILSKISQMESSEATQHLTSAMNGFKLEASEVIGIVDKLNAVDLESASDAAGLAESLSRCANSANVAGISMDRLISYIATVSEVTQKSASSVGEGFKSITARLQNIKVNKFIDEDGTNISSEISDAEKILNKFDIALRKNAKEFRDAQDVIDDVAKSWHNMSSVEQSAIASAFGTVHQRENVIALFENYNRVLELTEVSANSAGTAMEKFAVYENSLEAATNRLTASLQGIAYNTIDSDFLKNLANGTAQIVEFIDKTQLLKTGLTAGIFTGAITGLVALGTRMVAVRNNVTQFTQAMNISRQSTSLNANQLTQLIGNVQGLSQAQLRLVVSSRQLTNEQRIQIVSATGLSRAEAETQLQTWGLANAENGAATATFSLRGAWEGLKASIISNPIGLIVAGLTTAVTVISNVKQRQEELRQSISDTAQTAKEQTDKLNDLISTYEEFANKVTYTAEEKAKLKSIQEQLVEAYHTEVDGIDLVNGKYDEQIEKLRQLKKEKLEDAELSLIAEREQAKQDSKNGTVKDVRFKISSENFKTEDDYNKIAQALKELKTKSSNYAFSDNISLIDEALGFDGELHFFSGNSKQRVKEIKEVMNVLKEYGYTNLTLYSELNDLLVEHQKLVDAEDSAISNLAENKFQQYQLNNPYDEKAGKDAYLSWKNGLIDSAEGDTELQQELTTLAEKQFPDYQKYFDNIAELKAKYVDTAADISNAISKMDFINALSDEDVSIAVQIPNLFKEGLDGAEKAIAEFKTNPANKIETEVDTDNIEDFSKVIETASKKQSALKSAMEDMADTGYLSSDTYATLIELGGNFTKCLELQNGKLTLNTEKLKDLEKQEYLNTISANKLSIAELQLAATSLKGVGTEWITEKITELEQQNALYETLIDEINKVKPDDKKKSSSSSSNDKPQSVLDFEKELARRQHKIKVGEMKEDEDYYNWLEKAYRKAYDGVKDCQDDIYKYEEMVYDGRKKLAEDLYKEQQKAFENRVSDLEAQITVTEKHSVDSDENSLDVASKFDYIRAIYNDLITETENRINEIIQAGIEGHEEEVKELEKQIEEYRDKLQETFKDEIEYEIDYISTLEKKYEDFIDKRIKQYEKEKDAVKDRYDSEIKSLDKTIDALKDKNDETKNAIELKKAEQDLEKSRQRTRMTYGSDGTIVYKQDDEAIAEAQQKVDDIKLDMIINNLEKQKEGLEEQKATEVDKYDDMITVLNEQKDTQEKYFETLIEILSNYLNPKSTENIQSVWDRIFADKENVKVNDTTVNVKGTDIDTSGAVFGEADADKINQTLDKVDEASQKFKETGDFIDQFMKDLYAKSGKTPDAYERYKRGEFGNVLDSLTSSFSYNNMIQKGVGDITRNITTNKVINNSQPTTFNFGDINVNNPVGDAKKLAKEVKSEIFKEAMMQIPNVAMKQIHSNLK